MPAKRLACLCFFGNLAPDDPPGSFPRTRPAGGAFSFNDGWVTSPKSLCSIDEARGGRASTHGGTLMKHAMGAVLALALGVGLAVSAQATGIKQNSMSSPNLQSGSTEQMQQGQIRKKRVTIRHQQKGKMAVAKLNRHDRIAIAQKQKLGKTRLATLKQRKGMQF